MARDIIAARRRDRGLQPYAILLAAIAQIVTARMTDALHAGVNVELRSAIATHPLVPLGPAFAIWGAIYIFALVAAIWQLLPEQKSNPALGVVGWNIAAIGFINAAWQIWVPLQGFDWISAALVFGALVAGLTGLLRLRQDMVLSRRDEALVFAPLALVTGWLTAACFVNFTTVLVSGYYALDPTHINVSLAFLIGLVLFGGVMSFLTESLMYSAALVWALGWILLANIYRDQQPSMVTICVIGIALVGLVSAWAITHRHESGPLHPRHS